MRAQILINGFDADFLHEDVKDYFTIEKGVEDDDPTGQPSDQAINLKLPNTPRNNKIFGFSVDNASKNTEEYEVKILGNGFTVFEGIGCISDIDKKECANYVLDVWGGQARWVLPLEDMNLCDCIPGTTEHQLNAQTIVDSWSGNDDYVYYPVGYDFIKWHEGIKPTDLRPAIFIYPIVKEIFKKLGYKIKSSFIESNFFKRLTMPFTFGSFGKGLTYYEENTKCDESIVPYTAQFAILPLSGYVIGRNQDFYCTASETGVYCFCFEGTFFANSNPDANVNADYEFYYEILPPGFTYPTGLNEPNPPNGTRILFYTEKGVQHGEFIVEEKFTIELQTGESLVIWMDNNLQQFDTTINSARLQGTKIGYYYSQNNGEGDIINFKDFIPVDLKAVDLIKDLKKLFNWRFETDNYRKTICIESRHGGKHSGEEFEPFFMEEVQSATPKILNNNDISTKASYKTNIPKREIFSYKNDGDDYYQKNQKEEYPDTLYRAIFKSDKTLATGEKKCTTDFFAGTMHKRYKWNGRVKVIIDGIPSYVETNANGIIPFILSEEQTLTESIDIKDYDETFCPRILYYHGFSRVENDIIPIIDPLNTDELLDNYPLAYQVNYDDPTGTDPNLGFSDDIVLGGNVQGLTNKYYLLELILKRDRYLKGVQMLFSPHEIHKFSFRKMWSIRMDTDSSLTKWIALNFKDFTTIARCPLSMEFQRYRLPTKQEKQNLSSWTCTGLIGKSPVLSQNGCTPILFQITQTNIGGRLPQESFMAKERFARASNLWCFEVLNIGSFDSQESHIVIPDLGIDVWVPNEPLFCVEPGEPLEREMRFEKCGILLEIRIALTDDQNYTIHTTTDNGEILALQVVNGEEIINLDLLKICC